MAKKKVVHSFASKPEVAPNVDQVAWGAAVAMSICVLLVSAFIVLAVSWQGLPFLPPLGGSLPSHVKSWSAVALNSLSSALFPTASNDYRRYLATVASSGQLHLLYARLGLACMVSVPLSGWALIRSARPFNGIMHTDGRQLEDNERNAVQKENVRLAGSIEKMGGDLYIHPKIQYTMEQFSRQTLVFGAIGGGKTTIIMFLLHQIFAQDHKAIIYDNKGEMSAQFPQASLLAPWQKGSLAWDIARDCQTRQDAQLFAAQCIPEGKENPMWSNAARQVMVGLIVSLQVAKPLRWGWQDLADVITTGMEDLLPLMERYNPEAISIAESQNQTTYGVLISMRAGLSWISDMAQAWGNPAPGAGISFVDWIYDDDCKEHRQIILQGNGRFEQMMRGYVSSIVSLMVSHINSPKFKRSRSRRMWFILDEFIQLGKLHFMPLIEIGRSKGIRSVLGVQSVEQITEVYGANLCSSLLAMIGTKVVCQIAPGETAKKIGEMIGSRDVERINLSVSSQAGGSSTTRTINRDKIDVIHESRLSTDLGNRPELGAIVALLINIDSPYVLMLPWPHDKTPEARDSYIEADWVSNSVATGAGSMVPMASLSPDPELEEESHQHHGRSPALASVDTRSLNKGKAVTQAEEISAAFSARRALVGKPSKDTRGLPARESSPDWEEKDHAASAQPRAPNPPQPARSAPRAAAAGSVDIAVSRASSSAANASPEDEASCLEVSLAASRHGPWRRADTKASRISESEIGQRLRDRQIQRDAANYASAPLECGTDPLDFAHTCKTGDVLAHEADLSGDTSGFGALVALAPLILDSATAERPLTKAEKRLALEQGREKLLSIDRDRDG